MRRREFILALGGGATAGLPLAAWAQQRTLPLIGFLSPGPPGQGGPLMAAFLAGLGETGHTEGQNVTIEYHSVEQSDRLPAIADLVGRKVDAIMVVSDPVARAAKSASSTIPVVFFVAGDPVADGLVASLARPGGNLTGVTVFGGELNPKRLELLAELVPPARVIAVLMNPDNPLAAASVSSANMRQAARAREGQIQIVKASSESEIDAAFASIVALQAGALVVDTDLLFFVRREQIAALAARYFVPAIYYRREFAAAGGLISYGPSFATAYRQAGIYTGKILGGARPSDLPVMQPTKFELVINLKTAKALGLEIPPTLLARADEVIE
jgi:putative ABC transport system substrate-binding protein